MKDIHAFEPIWENWVIDDEIGHGSYGTVWKAHREDQFCSVEQYAAVKHISIPKQEGQGEDDIPFPTEEAKSRYYRNMLNQLIGEINAMISLRGKPNIVSYEEHKVVPKDNNSGYDLFLRMELLTSISKYCPFEEYYKHPLKRSEVIQLGIDIATALEILENRNFVHRDVKPGNVFIDDEGHFKLGDFGTARVLEVTGNASTKAGTPNYMAPEVYTRVSRYDQTVDIYSLGIMLYRYMNNGYLPFMSETELEADIALTRRIQGEPLPPPCSADADLSKVILKACAYKPEDRYQNAAELINDLIKCKKKEIRETEVPVVCWLDDGEEIYRGYKKAGCNSQIKVTTQDIPYKKFTDDDKELISPREVSVSIDENGKCNPPEAAFVFSDCKTLFAVSVQIRCQDENHDEILVQKVQCIYQHRNLVKAPEIKGYAPVGQTEVEVEVLKNRTSRPPEVVFEYRKDKNPEREKTAECDVPIVCMLENGEEILNLRRTCREDASNLVTAPEITGYILIGEGSKTIRVSHTGDAEPDKVIFAYKRMKEEKKNALITVICRDDTGNEIKREVVIGEAGRIKKLTAPEIDGFRLSNESSRSVELTIDEKGIPEQDEVVFVFEKKKTGPGLKKTMIIGLAAAFILISAGIGTWLLNRPVSKYTVTWKYEDGTILEQDNEVASGTMPEYNGSVPSKEADQHYSYTFEKWQPAIETVTGDATYTATFTKKLRSYKITWQDDTGAIIDTTLAKYSTKPTHSDLMKEADQQYSYTFEKWQPAIETVAGDATYTAMFTKKLRSYKITWLDDTGAIIDTTLAEYGTKPNHSDPTKGTDQQYTYTFENWQPAIETVTDDATYTATYKKKVRTYKITWLDDTGAIIDTTRAEYGTKPTHPAHAKEADQQYLYIFEKWQPTIETVTGDATYTATYKKKVRTCRITWLDDTGARIDITRAEYGTKPTHSDPIKEADRQYSYTFEKWQPDIETVTGDATYSATFKKELRRYTITWQDDTGTTIDTTLVEYGTKPTHPDPIKNADQQYSYTFEKWQPDIETVTGDATYTATFTAEPITTSKSHWICSKCNAENSTNDLFCTNCAQTRLCLECGYSVPRDDRFCSNCRTEAGKWKCLKCGTYSDANNRFCENCGTERHEPGVH